MRITFEHYSDSTERVSPGIERLLPGGKRKDKIKALRTKSQGNRQQW
jgi:hypothetical protein